MGPRSVIIVSRETRKGAGLAGIGVDLRSLRALQEVQVIFVLAQVPSWWRWRVVGLGGGGVPPLSRHGLSHQSCSVPVVPRNHTHHRYFMTQQRGDDGNMQSVDESVSLIGRARDRQS